MEAAGTPSEPREGLDHVDLDRLRSAIAIYLERAYPSGTIPTPVRARLEWDASITPDRLLIRPPFEKVGKGAASELIVALRLGNERYPHMKLQIQPWSGEQGFLLSVNTHDQILALAPDSPDAPAFRSLQADNQRIKEAIEAAWDDAGLPTFLRYLRDYLRDNPAGAE